MSCVLSLSGPLRAVVGFDELIEAKRHHQARAQHHRVEHLSDSRVSEIGNDLDPWLVVGYGADEQNRRGAVMRRALSRYASR